MSERKMGWYWAWMTDRKESGTWIPLYWDGEEFANDDGVFLKLEEVGPHIPTPDDMD